jgi:putative FmdB family regulatory protein
MPTYDYRCNACDHTFEEFQMMSAKPLTVCPECDEKALERLIGTGAGLIFKGSGFYETDYRSESYKKAAEKEAKAGSGDSNSKADKKTESKSDTSAAKPEKKADKPSGDKKSAASAPSK